MEADEERLRGARGSLELKNRPEGKERRKESGEGHIASNRSGAIMDYSTASLSRNLVEFQ